LDEPLGYDATMMAAMHNHDDDPMMAKIIEESLQSAY
jgi:hypothetical protein